MKTDVDTREQLRQRTTGTASAAAPPSAPPGPASAASPASTHRGGGAAGLPPGPPRPPQGGPARGDARPAATARTATAKTATAPRPPRAGPRAGSDHGRPDHGRGGQRPRLAGPRLAGPPTGRTATGRTAAGQTRTGQTADGDRNRDDRTAARAQRPPGRPGPAPGGPRMPFVLLVLGLLGGGLVCLLVVNTTLSTAPVPASPSCSSATSQLSQQQQTLQQQIADGRGAGDDREAAPTSSACGQQKRLTFLDVRTGRIYRQPSHMAGGAERGPGPGYHTVTGDRDGDWSSGARSAGRPAAPGGTRGPDRPRGPGRTAGAGRPAGAAGPRRDAATRAPGRPGTARPGTAPDPDGRPGTARARRRATGAGRPGAGRPGNGRRAPGGQATGRAPEPGAVPAAARPGRPRRGPASPGRRGRRPAGADPVRARAPGTRPPRPPVRVRARTMLRRSNPRHRLNATLLVIAVVLSLFAGRLVQMQGLDWCQVPDAGRSSSWTSTIPIPTLRGSITTSDGLSLAMTEQTDTIIADPKQMSHGRSGPAWPRDAGRPAGLSAARHPRPARAPVSRRSTSC